MELIPILSTIILVATISTFLLAIGAYILYKVRERRGLQTTVAAPATVKAELVTPTEVPTPIIIQEPREQIRVVPQQVYVETPVYKAEKQTVFVQQQGKAYTGTEYEQPKVYRETSPAREKKFTESKFLKYTSEGYVPAKEDKNSGALKWR